MTSKAFTDFKESSTSSDSETRLFNRKTDEPQNEKKISKFKPPLTVMKDENIEIKSENIKEFTMQDSFKSENMVTESQENKKTYLDEEHKKTLKKKEKKLKESYYLIKLYMIVLKTATFFSKHRIETSKLL